MPQNKKQETIVYMDSPAGENPSQQIPVKNIVISDKAYMDSMTGENPLSSNPVKDYVIYEDKKYYIHPIYNQYGASKSGKVINHQTMRKLVGRQNHNGYLSISVKTINKTKQKTMQAHRFIYECFHGQIPSDMVIDHINNIKDDNRIKNLQMMTQQDNCLKSAKNRDYGFAADNHKNRKCVKATNCETKETSYFKSVYSVKEHLGINPGLVQMVAEGLNKCKTAMSKMNHQSYIFEYIDEAELPDNHLKSSNIRRRKYTDEEKRINQKERIKKWQQQSFTCPHCNKQLKNGSKYTHKKSCIPKTLNKRDSVDLTEDEKQLIDEKYNAMMNKIQRKQIPYYTKLQQHFE